MARHAADSCQNFKTKRGHKGGMARPVLVRNVWKTLFHVNLRH